MILKPFNSVIFGQVKYSRLLLVTLAVIISASTYAQNDSSYNWKNHFFLGFINSYYIDFVSSPVTLVDMSRDLGGGITSPDTAVPFQTSYVSYISVGLEPRLNIYEFNKDLAIAIAAPMTIGLGQAFPQSDVVEGATGYGSIQIPFLFKAHYGSHSTLNNTSDLGFSIGAGYEYNKLSIISTDNRSQIKDANKGWIMPVFSASAHVWWNNSPVEVSLKYGQGKQSSYTVNKYGQGLSDGIRYSRATSIKLSFIYLFN